MKWDYHILRTYNDSEIVLKSLGRRNWELVTVIGEAGLGGGCLYYFKRPLTDSTPVPVAVEWSPSGISGVESVSSSPAQPSTKDPCP